MHISVNDTALTMVASRLGGGITVYQRRFPPATSRATMRSYSYVTRGSQIRYMILTHPTPAGYILQDFRTYDKLEEPLPL